ncbi:fumarylacetoacetate hydrolase family protein [Pseudoroseicyclus sp. CXY001]|uniref:fumarylacetoacetate hydrolase family protein n=1 Tax=Pseudoroseicyclus sp. CXY001 TaxID=3242492 RepID=UPI003570AF87
MRFVSFNDGGRHGFGVKVPGGIHDLGARTGSPDLKSWLAGGPAEIDVTGADPDIADGAFDYLPVIPNPGKILCVGLNYETHRKETGRPEAAHPAIFTRFADSLAGHGQPLVKPDFSDAFDYEGELALVIGQPCFRVTEAEALAHVAGYACFNDATLRDWQRHTHQFTPGKNFPRTGGFGPELVTPDEAGELADQPIETRVNGVTVQSARLGQMIFGIAEVIAYVSAFTPLSPGDVIATGTPGGVGFKREPQLFLKPGDRVEVSIGGIGTLENSIGA